MNALKGAVNQAEIMAERKAKYGTKIISLISIELICIQTSHSMSRVNWKKESWMSSTN